ncbi:MAG: hypothetical protein A49_10000 [Methyloceanibacter sp.]|nr:MAG: hypothetical protein A49_10000 [Methyloceanibacter sp.]
MRRRRDAIRGRGGSAYWDGSESGGADEQNWCANDRARLAPFRKGSRATLQKFRRCDATDVDFAPLRGTIVSGTRDRLERTVP